MNLGTKINKRTLARVKKTPNSLLKMHQVVSRKFLEVCYGLGCEVTAFTSSEFKYHIALEADFEGAV